MPQGKSYDLRILVLAIDHNNVGALIFKAIGLHDLKNDIGAILVCSIIILEFCIYIKKLVV